MIAREMAGSPRLSELMYHLRDAFLWSNILDDDIARKKLLHLIELQAAEWQLSPDAVNYYFPSAVSRRSTDNSSILAAC